MWLEAPALSSTAWDILYDAIDWRSDLTTVEELLAFRGVQHPTLLNHLVVLHTHQLLSRQQLEQLYGLDEASGGVGWSTVQSVLSKRIKRKAREILREQCGTLLEAQDAQRPGLIDLQVALVNGVMIVQERYQKHCKLRLMTRTAAQSPTTTSTHSPSADTLKNSGQQAASPGVSGPSGQQEKNAHDRSALGQQLLSEAHSTPAGKQSPSVEESTTVDEPTSVNGYASVEQPLEAHQNPDPHLEEHLRGLALLTPAPYLKVTAFLSGHSVEEIADRTSGKRRTKVATVQDALIHALSVGVQLPKERLLQAFKLGPDAQGGLTWEHVAGAVEKQRLERPMCCLANSMYWHVREELLSDPATEGLVEAQEPVHASSTGRDISSTMLKIRLVTHLLARRNCRPIVRKPC